MNLYALLRLIESHDFAAHLGLANNLEMLFAQARQNAAVKQLLTLLSDEAVALQLLAHVGSLLREQDDVRYRNSRDGAIAVYIWALTGTQPALARLAASAALNAPRLWWAKKAALNVASPTVQPGKTESKVKGLLTRVGAWRESGEGNQYNVLIVSDPAEDLIRAGRVLDPSSLTVTTDAAESQLKEVDYSAKSDSLSEALRTVQR